MEEGTPSEDPLSQSTMIGYYEGPKRCNKDKVKVKVNLQPESKRFDGHTRPRLWGTPMRPGNA